MKVLHVIPSMSPVHGGATRALELTAQALQRQGVEADILTTDDDGTTRLGLTAGATRQRGGLRLRYFARWFRPYKVAPGLALWLLRHARDYDLVHVHALFSFAPVAAAWICRVQRVPYVVEPLGVLNAYGLSRRRPWIKRLMLRMVEGPLLRSAAAVRFTSTQEEREAGALGLRLRGAVIPLGLPPRSDTPGHADALAPGGAPPTPELSALAGRDFLLFLSRLDPKKNLEVLIEAMALLARDGASPMLLVAGAGEAHYVARLRDHARAAGVGDRIVWPGHLDGAVKAWALAHARAFVLPSHSENFCIAAVEALQAGLPCVLSPGVAVAQEIAEAGAGLLTAPDPPSVAGAVRLIIGSPDRAAGMSRAALHLANERFSTEPMGRALKTLYEGILSR